MGTEVRGLSRPSGAVRAKHDDAIAVLFVYLQYNRSALSFFVIMKHVKIYCQ